MALGTPSHHEDAETPGVKFQLLYDAASGEYMTQEWTDAELDDWENSGYRTQSGHYTEVGLYDSEVELQKAVEELRGKPVFAVFEDRAAGTVFMSEEDNLSGNWRGSKYGHSNCVAEFATKEEAENYVRKTREHYDRIDRERN